MPTWRNFAKKTFRCSLYEAQDVLLEMDSVDLIPLDMTWGAWFNEDWLRIPLYHDVSRKLMFVNPGLKKVRLTKDYEVFIAVCNSYWDLPYINAIERWRNYCKISVCWIDEMWAADIPCYNHWLHALSQFDYVFVGMRSSVSTLSEAINRPCYWLPGGIDSLRFSPFPDPARRVIDVFSIGRRYQGVHQELLKAAECSELFYLHDTLVNVANNEVHHYQQHRRLFANMAKRSRYFVVAPAKTDARHETHGQIEIGYRYFEGAAAGAVMIGDVPNCEAYKELFGWPEAVFPVQPDGSDVINVVHQLDSEPERIATISKRNTRETLLRHDWAHRWSEMFRVAGIEPSPRIGARQERVRQMADLAAGAGENGTAGADSRGRSVHQ
jgi:spore maturation protein CgeB